MDRQSKIKFLKDVSSGKTAIKSLVDLSKAPVYFIESPDKNGLGASINNVPYTLEEYELFMSTRPPESWITFS